MDILFSETQWVLVVPFSYHKYSLIWEGSIANLAINVAIIFYAEKRFVSTVFEMSPARASQTTPQKPAIPDKPRIADQV